MTAYLPAHIGMGRLSAAGPSGLQAPAQRRETERGLRAA